VEVFRFFDEFEKEHFALMIKVASVVRLSVLFSVPDYESAMRAFFLHSCVAVMAELLGDLCRLSDMRAANGALFSSATPPVDQAEVDASLPVFSVVADSERVSPETAFMYRACRLAMNRFATHYRVCALLPLLKCVLATCCTSFSSIGRPVASTFQATIAQVIQGVCVCVCV
jgi:hypothetical protein